MSGNGGSWRCLLGGLVLVLAVAACKKDAAEDPKREVRLELKRAVEPRPEETQPGASVQEKKQDAKAESKVEPVKEEREGSEEKVGVQECDEYIDKFLACMEQQPEANRENMKAGFESTRQAWRAAAATEETRKELAVACRAALAGARRSPATKKCKW